MRAQVDLTGRRVNRLQVVSYDRGRREWLCRCDCGRDTFVRVTLLTSAKAMSCGCYRRERAAPNRTHNQTLTTEYRSWRAMKRRCLNPRASQFALYGGRGIKICQRWVASFEAFLADMGKKPSPGHSLDRIDNDGPYSPENCRWATARDQVANSRMAKLITHDGITDTLGGWEARVGFNHGVLAARLRRGWTVSDALTRPLRETSRTR